MLVALLSIILATLIGIVITALGVMVSLQFIQSEDIARLEGANEPS